MSHVRSFHSPFLDRLKARDAECADPRLSVRELISGPAGTRVAEAGQDRRLVRTTWTRLGEVLVIDDAVALIPSSGGGDLQVSVVRQPAVVRQLAQFVQAAWIQAACPQEPVSLPDGTEIEHRIVQLLAEGAKDETVARRLGISLRTCRRHIAEILTQLGASSRFQAGVRAAAPGTVAAGPGSYRPGRGAERAH
ncbi:hypothetical protein DN069_07835 [Streptacidiphilus pinicola]|uniref:HTH luxR-type domain-containing protein n=2 Tax=Streptacidiphilus pinicola TaxID=2219663 RepID=A0A2X0ISG9_9ACTN|nr:hypothetical protein DN069_07835 [Streptacidiphilus pinicola]